MVGWHSPRAEGVQLAGQFAAESGGFGLGQWGSPIGAHENNQSASWVFPTTRQRTGEPLDSAFVLGGEFVGIVPDAIPFLCPVKHELPVVHAPVELAGRG